MSIASKYNKGMVSFDFKPAADTFANLGDLYEQFGANAQYPIHGLYINEKSKFGAHPVAIWDECYISLPKHLTETVRQMLNDTDVISACNNGSIGLTIYPYESNGRTCYSVNWIDI